MSTPQTIKDMESLINQLLTMLANASSGTTPEAQARVTRPQSLGFQPVETMYGGAHLFRAGSVEKLQKKALESFLEHAPSAAQLAAALNMRAMDPDKQTWLSQRVYAQVHAKLAAGAIADFRIDFEDGFGLRPDAEEDAFSMQAADELAHAQSAGTLPKRIGIRIKAWSEATKHRALRTLVLFLGRLLSHSTPSRLPPGFVVTLPKVEQRQQVTALSLVLSHLEAIWQLPQGALPLEIMVETPAALVDDRGVCPLGGLVDAGSGRVLGAHLGAYDLTAALDIPAPFQDLSHPSCVFARSMMKAALTSRGVELSDGALHVIPVGDVAAVHKGWQHIYTRVMASLAEGYYQGWDIHPSQLPPRYAALYAFHLEHLENATARLQKLLANSAKGGRVGTAFDDAASGQGLLNFFRRGFAAGALSAADLAAAGLTAEDLQVQGVTVGAQSSP